MSVQIALRFMQQVAADDVLKDKIKTSCREASLENLVQIGREVGYVFSSEELQTAFKCDWNARWAFFCIAPGAKKLIH